MLVETRLVLRVSSNNIKDIETAIVNALYDTATVTAVIDMNTVRWANESDSVKQLTERLQASLDQRLSTPTPRT